MKIGVVIDSACDLPRSYIEKHNLEIMPVTVNIEGEQFVDVRDPDATMAFYKDYLSNPNMDAETEPLSVDAIRDLFLDEFVLKYDRVLVITIAGSRSPIYENATKASFAILSGYKERRKNAGMEGAFVLRVLDSKTMFTGEAILVHECLRLLNEEQLPFEKLRPAVEEFTHNIFAFLVPESLYYVRTRARAHGDRSVGWLSYKMGTMLDIKPILQAYRGETSPVGKVHGYEAAVNDLMDRAIERIKNGTLLSKLVAMSYSGNPEVVKKYPKYAELSKAAEEHGVELLLSVMSMTAAINVGPGTFTLAYAAPE